MTMIIFLDVFDCARVSCGALTRHVEDAHHLAKDTLSFSLQTSNAPFNDIVLLNFLKCQSTATLYAAVAFHRFSKTDQI